jgi:hypothetical protein
MSLENYFKPFRENIIGREQTFSSPFGEQKMSLCIRKIHLLRKIKKGQRAGLACNYFFKTVGTLK